MHEEKPGRAIGFKNERFSDKEEDGKAGPGEFKRSSEKAQAWETRLALYIGTYGNSHCNTPYLV